jgi:hypothetical protein
MELQERIDSLRRMVEAVSRRARGRAPDGSGVIPRADAAAQESEVPTLGGEMFYPLDYVHGALPVGSALSVPPDIVQVIAGDLRGSTRPGSTVFLDIETTGLAGGTGTLVFLVGLGRFEGEGLRLTQLFLDDPADERGMLEALSSFLAHASVIVTFNGKAFDLPLLETRYALNRMNSPVVGALHADLLGPSRRLWSSAIGSCSLASVERHVLAVRRLNDVPGWLIPTLYADYLRTRDAAKIAPVVAHNRLDVLSLTVLFARIAACFQTDTRFGPRCASEALGAAIHYDALGFEEAAMALYQQATRSATSGDVRSKAVWGVLRLSKRSRLWDQCGKWAQELVVSARLDPRAWVELAKYHEHRTGDLATALLAARRALEVASSAPDLTHQTRVRLTREIMHRIARLERRSAPRRADGRVSSPPAY